MSAAAGFRLRDPVHCLALGFGAGLAPRAPGTAGTLLAIPIYLLAVQAPLWLYGVLVALGFAVGVYACERTARDVGVHDHPAIVWDEVIGYLVTMSGVAVSLPAVVVGFVAFRLFDIWKPPPIRQLDRAVSGGLGIMLDDLIAGAFAAVTTHLALWLWQSIA